MNGFLIDTNVISEVVKPGPNPKVVAWLESRESIVLSAVSLEELTCEIERAKGKTRDSVREWFSELLASELGSSPSPPRSRPSAGGCEPSASRSAAGSRKPTCWSRPVR